MQASKQDYLHLMIFYSFISFFFAYSNSVIPPYLLDEGITIPQMLIGKLIPYAAIIPTLIFTHKLINITSWRLSLIIQLTYLLLLALVPTTVGFYLAMFIGGFVLVFFYVTYNITHFQLTPKHRTGLSSAVMFTIPAAIGVISPVISGYAATININYLWLTSIILCAITFYFSKLPPKITIKYSLSKGFQQIQSVAAFIIIEGIWEAIVFAVIPIYTLYFITTPLKYGLFLAYLSLAGALVSLIIGNHTDVVQRRSIWLFPINILLSLFTIGLAFGLKSQTLWLIFSGAIYAILPIFWKLSTSLMIDINPQIHHAMPARELLLSIGRLSGIAIVTLGLLTHRQSTPIIILAVILLIFPLLQFHRQYIAKSHSYL